MESTFNVFRFIIIPYNSNPLNRFNHMESTMNDSVNVTEYKSFLLEKDMFISSTFSNCACFLNN